MNSNNDSNKKTSGFAIWLIAAALVAIGYILVIAFSKHGLRVYNNKQNVMQYNSLVELNTASGMNVELPSIIDINDDLKYQYIDSTLYVIYCDKYALKVTRYMADNIDTLGLYNEAKVDEFYYINNSDIKSLRYRADYVDFPNCTILNWNTDEYNYGLMIGNKIDFDEVLDILDIEKSNLSDKKEEQGNNEITENISYNTYNINGNKVLLPEFNAELSYEQLDGCTIFRLNGTDVFIFVYSEEGLNTEANNKYNSVEINNELRLDYLKNNPFDDNTEASNDYDIFVSAIDYIVKTTINE